MLIHMFSSLFSLGTCDSKIGTLSLHTLARTRKRPSGEYSSRAKDCALTSTACPTFSSIFAISSSRWASSSSGRMLAILCRGGSDVTLRYRDNVSRSCADGLRFRNWRRSWMTFLSGLAVTFWFTARLMSSKTLSPSSSLSDAVWSAIFAAGEKKSRGEGLSPREALSLEEIG